MFRTVNVWGVLNNPNEKNLAHVPKEFSNLREFFLELVALLVSQYPPLLFPSAVVLRLVSVSHRPRRSGILL